ncbi:MAG: miaA [Acidimicrobiaceae bacterium]|nr:miaA [Acidimicrobiaceae bacterium]
MGRLAPVAAARPAIPSAGECGEEDQVSRSGPSAMAEPTRPGARPVALVGPTATGKTALALALAAELGDAELVSVDAMAVYRGMDLGTAKPTAHERAAADWHLLDLVEPDEEFSVASFQRAAADALAAIAARGRRAVLVGGTGLYHRAVLDRLELPGRYPDIAAGLHAEAAQPGGSERLHARLAAVDPLAASRMESSNARRVVRALEVTLGAGRPFSSFGPGLETYAPTPYLLVGLALPREELDRRISERLEAQLTGGWLEEVAALAARPRPLSRTAGQALGYRQLLDHLAGELSLEEARAEIVRRTRAFARRQESWFRRDPRVHWLDAMSSDLLARVLELLSDDRRREHEVGE